MPTGATLVGFLATAVVIVAIPGPSLLFTIGRALTVGRRDALLTVLGNALGLLVQTVLVAAGVGALLATSATAYTVVKLAGAACLVFLGVQAFRHRGDLGAGMSQANEGSAAGGSANDGSGAVGSSPGVSTGRSLVQGLAVGVGNPKTLVFLSSLLPQFIDPTAAPQPQILALGAVFALMALVGDSVWALAASQARAWFGRSPRRLRVLGGTGGALMAGLGITMAAAGRPQV
ncbi:MAG: LysE family translocator [Candidatus Phosphoribacter sp.]|nr:LysE family translocator [Actinomycetales bacterium]